jgi:hypothetical protein
VTAPTQAFPHAPYADGPADFGIGLRPIAIEAWFEGGEDTGGPRARKAALLAANPARIWAELEGSRAAQAEAAALVCEALGRSTEAGVEPPLLSASLHVADDLCLLEKAGGQWTLTALSLSAGTFFTAEEAIGKTLEGLHAPVPGFGDRFLHRVARIFDALATGVVLERRNWTVLNAPDLHLPDPAPVRARIPHIGPDAAAEALFLRVERQTLRRLPETGGVLFTIRVWTQSLAELARDPVRLAAFARAWRTATPDFRAYKRLELYDTLVEAVLERSLPLQASW